MNRFVMLFRAILHASSWLFPVLALFASCSADPEGEPVSDESRTLFIILDGISADVLEKIDTPNLDTIAREGAYTRAWIGGVAGEYSESPTVSAVGYNHLITGVWSNKHNVYGNEIEDPNYHYWNIFRLADHNDPELVTAIYSSWLENRTELAGDGKPEAGGLSIDIVYDGFELDTLAFPHKDDGSHIQEIDWHVSELAAESVLNDSPDLAWVYLWYPDTAAHRYGDGPEAYEALRVGDEQIGRIYDAVRQRQEQYGEEWLFVVTTDHGRDAEGFHHGGHSERERTIWIITNHSGTNRYFHAIKPAIVDIYPMIARHMNIEIPQEMARELDGVPLLGDVSLSHADAQLSEDEQSIQVVWKAWHDSGDVRIYVTSTNQFADGGSDEYMLAAEVPLINQGVEIDVSELHSDFYKIVIEGEHNSVNRWIVND